MAKAKLELSTKLIIELLKGLAEGESPRSFRVEDNGLPKDTRYVRTVPHGQGTVMIELESEEFEEGALLPAVLLRSVVG